MNQYVLQEIYNLYEIMADKDLKCWKTGPREISEAISSNKYGVAMGLIYAYKTTHKDDNVNDVCKHYEMLIQIHKRLHNQMLG